MTYPVPDRYIAVDELAQLMRCTPETIGASTVTARCRSRQFLVLGSGISFCGTGRRCWALPSDR